MSHKELSSNTDEQSVNPKRYPPEWFDIQLQYADRWAHLAGVESLEVRRTKTGICRILPPDSITAESTARELYDIFAAQPGSDYVSRHRFGAFDYTYNADARRVKLHFENPERGTNPLAADAMPRRRAEFRELLSTVRDEHPDAEMLMSATWLRSTQAYLRLFPPDAGAGVDMMSSDMPMGRYYVWGQFIDRNGNIHEPRTAQFLEEIEAAHSTAEMIGAFPLKAMQADNSIQLYFDHYDV
jgi:hypothetical protein